MLILYPFCAILSPETDLRQRHGLGMEFTSDPYSPSNEKTLTQTALLSKRVMDITLCLVLLPLVLPLIFLAALLIRLESGRPIFFVQTRIGLHGKPFRLFKLRTLRPNFDPSRVWHTTQGFIRGEIPPPNMHGKPQFHKPILPGDTTRVGLILRQTSLDELPQLLNVLRGEMSLVGPRPHVEPEVKVYADWHHKRLLGLPGITGLTQVRGNRLTTFDEMVQSDWEYLDRQNVRLDLKILVWTVFWVCFGMAAPE